jgi:hypothetical protein
MKTQALLRASCTAVFVLATASEALAAEGFKLRFPVSGTLGGEIVAPMPSEGTFGSIVVTDINVNGITGSDGNPLQQTTAVPVVIPEPQATAVATKALTGTAYAGAISQVATILKNGTASVSGTSNIEVQKYHQTVVNITLGHVLSNDVNGGRLVTVVNIPYAAVFDTSIKATGSLTPGSATGVQQAANNVAAAAAADKYKASLAAVGESASVSISGLGDIEASLLWEKSMDAVKVVAGATLVMPTGEYEYTPGTLKPNIGFGNYYTLRTGLGVAYTASESMTLGARASLGFNSQNMDSYVRSGDYYGIDLAAAFRTPVGVVGPHLTMLRQYTDDTGSALGANRLSITGAGFFYTVPIVALGKAGLNIAYMKTTDTKNSLMGNFVQARLTKVF